MVRNDAPQATSPATTIVEYSAMGERAIFFEAVEKDDPAERAAYLDDACAGDPNLRRRIEALLQSHATVGDFLDMPAAEQLAAGSGMPADRGFSGAGLASPERSEANVPLDFLAPSRRPDSLGRLGHYEVLEVIGQGGMGTVYKAEQDSPRRTVALKVVRPGFASPAIVKRFNHEAQILGRLHHPGIAQVYEAGLADDGQPYFAMEFIHGLPLDEYARRRGLDLTARVGLVARVCDAVQHAARSGGHPPRLEAGQHPCGGNRTAESARLRRGAPPAPTFSR